MTLQPRMGRVVMLLSICLLCLSLMAAEQAFRNDLNEPFLRAVMKGENSRVEELLRMGADPNTVHPLTGWSALGVAAFYGWPEIVSLLLQNGANVNHVDKHGRTPLMKAVTLGPYDSLEEVLTRKAGIAKKLLEAGANPYASDPYGQPVWEMPRIDRYPEILSIFESAGIRKSKETELITAIGRNDLKRVRELISDGANVNFVDTYGWSPLREAVQTERTEIVLLLIEAGAAVNARFSRGCTVLMIATEQNRIDMARLLIRSKADPDIQNDDGLSSRSIASKRGLTEILSLFGSLN